MKYQSSTLDSCPSSECHRFERLSLNSPFLVAYPSTRIALKGVQAFVYDDQGDIVYQLFGSRLSYPANYWRISMLHANDSTDSDALFFAIGSEYGSSFRNNTMISDKYGEIGVMKESLFGSRLSLKSDKRNLLHIRLGIIPVQIDCRSVFNSSVMKLTRASECNSQICKPNHLVLKADVLADDANLLHLFCSIIVPLVMTEGTNVLARQGQTEKIRGCGVTYEK